MIFSLVINLLLVLAEMLAELLRSLGALKSWRFEPVWHFSIPSSKRKSPKHRAACVRCLASCWFIETVPALRLSTRNNFKKPSPRRFFSQPRPATLLGRNSQEHLELQKCQMYDIAIWARVDQVLSRWLLVGTRRCYYRVWMGMVLPSWAIMGIFMNYYCRSAVDDYTDICTYIYKL